MSQHTPGFAGIAGLGIYLPRTIAPSREFDARLALAPGWIERASGVRQRHIASADETQEHMGAEAARAALAEAGASGADLDLILFAASVGRQPIPATAPLIKRELGLSGNAAPAYDVNATCLSALVALDIAALHIAAGRARNVLIVTSEIASRALPWHSDPRTAGLFGDGAAALLMRACTIDDACRLGAVHMETYEEGYDYCELRAGGTRYDFHEDHDTFAANAWFDMKGAQLYRLSSEAAPGFIARLLEKAGWRQDEVDLVVPHQASPHALAHIIKRCGFPAERVIDVVAEIGNQVAASWPIALHKARAQGRLRRGMKVLLLGTSAGVSLGGAALVA